MEKKFMTDLTIKNVRHLKDIKISLCDEKAKHLIFTGKNGSGKTSVLEAISDYLKFWITSEEVAEVLWNLRDLNNRNIEQDDIINVETWTRFYKEKLEKLGSTDLGVEIHFICPADILRDCFQNGQFILAYYKAERAFYADKPEHIEKIELKDKYMMTDTPRQEFIKYLSDLKVTEALARNNGKHEKADSIMQWFEKFQDLLRSI